MNNFTSPNGDSDDGGDLLYEPYDVNKTSKDSVSIGEHSNTTGERKMLTSKEKIFELENILQERELQHDEMRVQMERMSN